MFGITSKSANKAVYRFKSAWEPIGFVQRSADNRTNEQIINTINEILKKSPEIEEFAGDLHKMDRKYLGLAADTLELSQRMELLPTAINMNKISQENGMSLIQKIMQVLPKASKENPGALEFTQEVINNTDTITSKYFLANLMGVIDKPELSNHFIAAKPMVREIAEQTLSGGYTMDYSKQRNFMKFVQTLVNPDVRIDKLELLPKLSKTADNIAGENPIYLEKFLQSDAPSTLVEENITTLPKVAELFEAEDKTFDIVDFITKNVNLK